MDLLRTGGVLGFPTDTVYGLAARDAGVPRVYSLKGRDPEKPLVLMAASAEELLGRVVVGPGALRLMRRFWPGPLTLVLPAVGGGTVGTRVPDHPVALALLAAAGPLWTTSANRSGQAEALSDREATEALPGLDAVLVGEAPGGLASTVVDLSGSRPVVLREGAVPASALSL